MRQEDARRGAEVGRLVLLEPEDFRRGVARQHGVAGHGDDLVLAAELLVELLALRGGGRVAPELGGRTGSLSSLSTTSPCCWPLTPMARTSRRRSPSWARQARTVASAASTQVRDSVPCDRPAGPRWSRKSVGRRRAPRRWPGRARCISCSACRCRDRDRSWIFDFPFGAFRPTLPIGDLPSRGSSHTISPP